MVRGRPGRGFDFRRDGSDGIKVAWVDPRSSAGYQRRDGPLECDRLATGDGGRGTAAWSDIFPVAFCLHADAVWHCPAGLAATAKAIYGGAAVGTMTAILSLVSGPLAFWAMSLLCANALPIAFAMRRISFNASGSNSIA